MRALQVKIGTFFFRHRNWAFPVLIAVFFSVAVPPASLFGNVRAEHVKDLVAVLIAVAGLGLRALVIGHRSIRRAGEHKAIHAAELFTDGLFSLCRNPLYTGNILILLGIFLMHGSLWTIVPGLLAYVAIYAAMIRAEEQYLLGRFGRPYADYCARVPRWIPNPLAMRGALRPIPFDGRQVLFVEYTNIGVTLSALILAEIYEELANPLVWGGRNHIRALACMLGVTLLGIAAVRFTKKRRRTAMT